MEHFEGHGTGERNVLLVGSPRSGKSSLVRLMGGKNHVGNNRGGMGIRLDRFEITDPSTFQTSQVVCREVTSDELDFVGPMVMKKPEILESTIVLINLEMQKTKLSVAKTCDFVEQITKKISSFAAGLPKQSLQRLREGFQRFHDLSIPDHSFLVPIVLVLNKFDLYLNSDMSSQKRHKNPQFARNSGYCHPKRLQRGRRRPPRKVSQGSEAVQTNPEQGPPHACLSSVCRRADDQR